MDFIIRKLMNNNIDIEIQYCESFPDVIGYNKLYIQKLKHLDYIQNVKQDEIEIASGDVILKNNEINNLSSAYGLYYLFKIINKQELCVKSDINSLLPIYYYSDNYENLVSSSFDLLSKQLKKKRKNYDFYTDVFLLYSNLEEETYYKEIKRVSYGSYIIINDNIKIINNRRFYDYFVDNPISVKKSIDQVAEVFISSSKKYYSSPCAVSLTGGFDGRANTGCAHYYNADFISCSFGKRGNGDVEIPIFLARELGLNYKLVELGDLYVRDYFVNAVRDSLIMSGGIVGFQNAQTLYFAQKIAEERKVIITGYFGSELFASVKHGGDDLCSQLVIDSVSNIDFVNSYAFTTKELLRKLSIINTEDDIYVSLSKLDNYLKKLPKDLSKNQILSVYNFENDFRNSFGSWIYIQMHYIKVRIPYFDPDFFEILRKTELSSFYRKFLDNNLYRRMDGQRLYPTILEKTWPQLNLLNSSKGYPPSQIRSFSGQILLGVSRFIAKQIKQSEQKEMAYDSRSRKAGLAKFLNNNLDLGINDIKGILNSGTMNESLCLKSISKMYYEYLLNS